MSIPRVWRRAALLGGIDLVVARTLGTCPHVSAEPPLACYVTASCPAAR